MRDEEAVVIGAGPAGLACAAELGRRGVSALVLERSAVIAASWRERYDRLRLNTSRWFSALPGQRYPRGTPVFPHRDTVIRYLESYAERHDLRILTGVEARRLERAGGGWLVHARGGDGDRRFATENVVVATGYFREPLLPAWPGRARYRGQLLHAAAYRNPTRFAGGSALVVGPGSSGMEIAYDLVEGGVSPVHLSVRTPPNILLRVPLGDAIALLLLRLPARIADAITAFVRARVLGDLREHGLPLPEEGIFSRLRRLGVAPAIVDKEIIAAIRSGRIGVVPAVDSLYERGAELEDGTRLPADAIIAATGYKSGLESLVGHLDVLDGRGFPRQPDGAEALEGLRFIGFRPMPAAIGGFGRQAQRIAREIAAGSRRSKVPDARGKETGNMLNNAHITTVLPAVDLDRARRFYGQTLGLREGGKTGQGGLIFRAADGTDIELMHRHTPTKAEHTALTFEVGDVERELAELEKRGVHFEDYDLAGLKTEHHIAAIGGEKAAWFKDTEGNILCIHQKAAA